MEQTIKGIFRELGADACGIADMERFRDAPDGFRPADIYRDCRSAVVFVKRLPRGVARVDPRIVYNRFNDMNVFEVDRIAYRAALAMEREVWHCTAVPLPADSPYDDWTEETLTGKGVLSMRHAAVAAGLGRLGKNTMLITPGFGNFITIGAVLTDLELAADLVADELCPPGCRRCLDACPTGAVGGASVEQARCRPHTYGTNARGFGVVNCNACRVACPLAFGAAAPR